VILNSLIRCRSNVEAVTKRKSRDFGCTKRRSGEVQPKSKIKRFYLVGLFQQYECHQRLIVAESVKGWRSENELTQKVGSYYIWIEAKVFRESVQVEVELNGRLPGYKYLMGVNKFQSVCVPRNAG
jgi:hypothetical protein